MESSEAHAPGRSVAGSHPGSPGRIGAAAASTSATPTTNSNNSSSLTTAVVGSPPPITAREEAAAVLEAIGGESHLNGFNLLGVIANPRGGSMTPSSFHGRYSSGGTSSPSGASPSSANAAQQGIAGASSDGISDTYYHTLETTLSQVTEQMEALNSVLEDWSRQILEDPFPHHSSSSYYEDQPPESMLTELPMELQHCLNDLQSLQSYLEASGVKAHGFYQRKQLALAEEAQLSRSSFSLMAAAAGGGVTDSDTAAAAAAADVVTASNKAEVEEEIPPRFFHSDFDLTDPETFRELLLLRDDDNDADNNHEEPGSSASGDGNIPAFGSTATTRNTAGASAVAVSRTGGVVVVNTDGPVHEWFPLPPQDTFGSFLDKVELALLQQVRAKSGVFFEESLRFAQLQETIQSLLAQVITMQDVMRQLRQDLVEPMETIPEADSQRTDLQELLCVLEMADEMLLCRSSIGGLLASQDDLTAINQIQYGRSLLSGHAQEGGQTTGVELRRLHSLKSVWDQLNQYELLVVTNLREELVEIFLGWNTAAVSSIYAINGTSALTSKCSLQVQHRVREIIGALQQCQALPETRDAYGNRLQEVIRMTVRTTVGEFASDASAAAEGNPSLLAVSTGATAMNLDRFIDCLDMLFEQLLALLTSASGVDEFCIEENFSFHEDGHHHNDQHHTADSAASDRRSSSDASVSKHNGPMASVVTSAAELSSKSISELLRLRKEAHSLVTLGEMKRIWDKCVLFATQVEELSGHHASALRSTLLAQAKAFVERKHESNMSALVAALESERWTQCEVSLERQTAMNRLCSGRTMLSPSTFRDAEGSNAGSQKSPELEVEGKRYKVVWSCLLLVEMIISDISAASHFPSLASSVVAKVSELLRLFNSRTTQLVLGAGAIHSTARLKSINAKHLSLVTQCLGMITSIFPHVRAGLMLQLPPKQHTLIASLDQIKREYADHNEKVLNKFVTIIGGIVEHGLAPKIPGTDFDARAKAQPSVPVDGNVSCCIFLEGVSTNTRKMHQVLASLLPPDHLQDVFSRIFAFVDKTVPTLFMAASEQREAAGGGRIPPAFSFPITDEGKRRLLLEVEVMTKNLNGLEGVYPWDFTVATVLGKEMEYHLNSASSDINAEQPAENTKQGGEGDEGEGNAACSDINAEQSAENTKQGGEGVEGEGDPASSDINAKQPAENAKPGGEGDEGEGETVLVNSSSDQDGSKPSGEGNSEAGSEVTSDTGMTTETAADESGPTIDPVVADNGTAAADNQETDPATKDLQNDHAEATIAERPEDSKS